MISKINLILHILFYLLLLFEHNKKQYYTKGIAKNTNKKEHKRVHEFATEV